MVHAFLPDDKDLTRIRTNNPGYEIKLSSGTN